MPILQMLEQTVTSPNANFNSNKDTQDMLAGTLQVILVKIGHTITGDIGNNIVKLLTMVFQSLKKVTENGLIAYSGLCVGMGDKVNVDDFGQYLLWALEG